MTARQEKGKRTSVALDWKRGRRVAAKPPSRKSGAAGSRERRRFLQLVACGAIFVLLVAAKLLLPNKMYMINQTISRAMEKNMDVQAVFSAVGNVFMQGTDVRDAVGDVYQAVFGPEGVEQSDVKVVLPEESAMELLHSYNRESPQEESAETEVTTLAYLLYTDENMPEDATMEPRILGFDYCTPVAGTVSSEFGYREHPVEGEERFHYGIDLAANSGTAIACFADGTVTAVGESSSYGKYCVISHENGYSTLYGHCSRITVSSGTVVEMGEKVAEVGETGMATGPHLHFELQQEGTYLNPGYYLAAV